MRVVKYINSFVSLIVFASLILLPADIQASSVESDNSALEANLLEIASAAMTQELNALVDNVDNQIQASSANGIDSTLYIDGIQENILFNQGLKEFLLSKDQKYVDYSTDIQPVSYNIEGDTAELEVEETRTLGLSDDGDMIADVETIYVQKHILKFEYDDDTWRLVQDIEIDSSVSPKILEEDEEWEPALDGSLLDSGSIENDIYLPLIFSDIAINTDHTISAASVNAPTGVDRYRIRHYAISYAMKPNRNYKHFGKYDCTNFVSQALKYGGWNEVQGWKGFPQVWWYKKSKGTDRSKDTQSWTWGGSHNLWRFIRYSGRGYATHWRNMRVGDVMHFDVNRDRHMDHTAIVTLISNRIPYLTYHSENSVNVSYWDFVFRSRIKNRWKYPLYTAWRLQ